MLSAVSSERTFFSRSKIHFFVSLIKYFWKLIASSSVRAIIIMPPFEYFFKTIDWLKMSLYFGLSSKEEYPRLYLSGSKLIQSPVLHLLELPGILVYNFIKCITLLATEFVAVSRLFFNLRGIWIPIKFSQIVFRCPPVVLWCPPVVLWSNHIIYVSYWLLLLGIFK